MIEKIGRLKLYQNKEDIILNKNHGKNANIFDHFVAIQNLENCQNFKIYENFKRVTET